MNLSTVFRDFSTLPDEGLSTTKFSGDKTLVVSERIASKAE